MAELIFGAANSAKVLQVRDELGIELDVPETSPSGHPF